MVYLVKKDGKFLSLGLDAEWINDAMKASKFTSELRATELANQYHGMVVKSDSSYTIRRGK